MIDELIWEKTSSFPSKTYKLWLGKNLFGVLDTKTDFSLTYICSFNQLKLELSKLNAVNLHTKSKVCEFIHASFNEYTIKTEKEVYIYNTICKEIFDTKGKTLITFENDSLFFPKKGKVKIHADRNIELLVSSLFYLKNTEDQN